MGDTQSSRCCACDLADEGPDREQFLHGFAPAPGSGLGLGESGFPDAEMVRSLAAQRQPHPRPWSDTRPMSDPRDLIPVLKLPKAALTPSAFTKPPGGAQHTTPFSEVWPPDASHPSATSDEGSIPGELSEDNFSCDGCSVPSELSCDTDLAGGSGPVLPGAAAAVGQHQPKDFGLEAETSASDFSSSMSDDLWSDRVEVVPAAAGGATRRPEGDEPLDSPADDTPELPGERSPAEEAPELPGEGSGSAGVNAEGAQAGGKKAKKGGIRFAPDVPRSDSNSSSIITFDMFGFKEEAEAEVARKRAEMSRLALLAESLGVEMPEECAFYSALPDVCSVPDLEEPDEVFNEQDREWTAARTEQIKADLKELEERHEEGPEFTSLGISMPSPHKRRTTLRPTSRKAQRAL